MFSTARKVEAETTSMETNSANGKNASESKVSLTLMIDRKANKVLFAEAGKDFVDILFNLLSLPLCSVIRLLRNNSMFDCIENLYQSIENLNEAYLQPNQNKGDLLKLHVTPSVLNSPVLQRPLPNVLFTCRFDHHHVTNSRYVRCPECKQEMTKGLFSATSSDASGGGIVKNLVSYMVMDDLSVTPVSMISGVDLLQHNVKDIGALEKRVVEFGTDEALELLKNAINSKAALTTVFLANKASNNIKVSSV